MSLATAGRIRLLAAAVLAITFVAGGLGGAAVERFARTENAIARPAPDERRDDDCDRRGDNDAGRRRSPYDYLDLSETQRAEIDRLLHRGGARMDSVSKIARARTDSVVSQIRADIRAVLTDEQRVEMDRRRAERMRRDSVQRAERRARCAQQEQQRQQGQQPGAAQDRQGQRQGHAEPPHRSRADRGFAGEPGDR
jgi:hypothetical protein